MFPLRDNVPSRSFPIITLLILVANALVFLFQLTLPAQALEALFHIRGVVPLRFASADAAEQLGYPPGAWTTMLSYMFLHGGWLHIIANLWALWLYGDNVEDVMGRGRYLFFFLVCGVLAAAVHVVLHPGSAIPTIGASGAIAGVMGAYFRMFPHARIVVMIPILVYPLLVEIPASVYLVVWILTQFWVGTFDLFSTGHASGVAVWAHIGGFIAGMLLADRK